MSYTPWTRAGSAAQASEEATREFNEVRQQRLEMFQNAFDHVLAEIDGVYKALTASPTCAALVVCKRERWV